MDAVTYIKEGIEKYSASSAFDLGRIPDVVQVHQELYDQGRSTMYWEYTVKTPYGFVSVVAGEAMNEMGEDDDSSEWDIFEVYPKVVQQTIYVKEEQ